MNTTFLKTLLAIRSTGSFSEAADLVNLSHSAVSVQMRRLEEDLGRSLFHKGRRPAQFTPFGARFCDMAVGVVADFDRLMRSAEKNSNEGTVRMGFVSTTLQTLLPVVLDTLAVKYPKIRVNAVSGLSDELATMVEREELDFGFVSATSGVDGNVLMTDFAREPLRIIAPLDQSPCQEPLELISIQPFIGFARRTRLGSQISQSLLENGIRVKRAIELDSIDAIENLVAEGRGVSVVPQRLFAADLSQKMLSLDFPVEANTRVLSLITPLESDREHIKRVLLDISDSAECGPEPN